MEGQKINKNVDLDQTSPLGFTLIPMLLLGFLLCRIFMTGNLYAFQSLESVCEGLTMINGLSESTVLSHK